MSHAGEKLAMTESDVKKSSGQPLAGLLTTTGAFACANFCQGHIRRSFSRSTVVLMRYACVLLVVRARIGVYISVVCSCTS
jgi:hypothetical protein